MNPNEDLIIMKRVGHALAALVCIFTFSAVFLVSLSPCGAAQGQQSVGITEGKRLVTDMAGRQVAVPKQVKRIVTIGAVPVLNSFIFAIGEEDKIVNGLPHFFSRSSQYKYQTLFAPALAHQPEIQGSIGGPLDIEALVKVSPDVIFTMDRATAYTLEKRGFAVIVLSWRQPEDVKRLMQLVGEVVNRQNAAAEYIKYFDDTVRRVREVVSRIPAEQRPKVLYCNIKGLTQPHLIAEWWIETAGGISVTNNGRNMENYAFSLEQMLAWNPDVLLVSSREDLKQVYEDRRFLTIKAVKSHRVFVAPSAAHTWANRTVEQPLTVLWAAKIFYPERFKGLNLPKEMKYFYGRFFHYGMSDQIAQEILEKKF